MGERVEVTHVSGSKDVKEFVKLPYRIYRKNRWWVPPLESEIRELIDPEHNFHLRKGDHVFLIARKGGKVQARLGVGIDGEINRAKNKKEGYLTLFESTEDYDVAEAILDYACNWLKEKGMNTILGPISPTRGDDYRGMLVTGFDSSPVLMNPYNPEYYPVFFERFGFRKETDFNAYYYDLTKDVDPRLINGVRNAMSRFGFEVHPIDLNRLQDELKDIKQIIDESMPEEWGYLVPPDLSDLEEIADKLAKLAEPTLVHIARIGDRPIGFGLAMPDYNQALKKVGGRLFPIGFLKFLWFRRKINGARFFVMFVVPEFHKKGVSAAIYLKTLMAAKELGYVYGEGSQIDETNIPMCRDAERSHGRLYKKYRLYRKAL